MFEPTQPARLAVAARGFRLLNEVMQSAGTMNKFTTDSVCNTVVHQEEIWVVTGGDPLAFRSICAVGKLWAKFPFLAFEFKFFVT